jgi:hypothetical protein
MSTPNISQSSDRTAFRPYIYPKESKIKTETVNFLATAAIASIAACFSPVLGGVCLAIYVISLVSRNQKTIKNCAQVVKEFFQFSLFKKSTPDSELQNILKCMFKCSLNEDERENWDKPIFIAGTKYQFDEVQGQKIVLKNNKNNTVAFIWDLRESNYKLEGKL